MNISSSEIITTLTGSVCMAKLFRRAGIETVIPIISEDYVRGYLTAEQPAPQQGVPNPQARVAAVRTAGSATLVRIYRGQVEDCPVVILEGYSQALIRAFKLASGIGWLGIIKNELELDILLSTMKCILVISRLDAIQENCEGFHIDLFLQIQNLLEKKIRYNLRLSGALQIYLISAYFNYWRDNCKKNSAKFLTKCGDIFVAQNNDVSVPYIEFETHDPSVEPDWIMFRDTVQLSNNFRGFLPDIFQNLETFRNSLTKEHSRIARAAGTKQTRVVLLESILDDAHLGSIMPRGSNKFVIYAKNHQEFIDQYRLPPRLQNNPRLIARVGEGYPGPQRPSLCFDLFDRLNFEALQSTQSFLKKSSQTFRLKPLRRTGGFQTRMLGHGPDFHEDRVDMVTIIHGTEDENEILASRFLWFKSDLFLAYPGSIKTSKHWTICPEGITVRISERNSRLNLILAIKLYSIWVEERPPAHTAANINNLLRERPNLWFMKGARRTYIGGIGGSIDSMKTSSLYQSYVNYLKGSLSQDEMRRHLATRWRDYIEKINSSLGLHIRALELYPH